MLNIYDAMECKVVVKPVMSSSGKDNPVPAGDPSAARPWQYADNMRGNRPKVLSRNLLILIMKLRF